MGTQTRGRDGPGAFRHEVWEGRRSRTQDAGLDVAVSKTPGEEVTTVVRGGFDLSWRGKQGQLFCQDTGAKLIITVTALFRLGGSFIT